MRRTALVIMILLLAPVAWAASPFALDQNGVLWKAASTADGLVLTGEVNGQVVVSSVVPFVVGTNGSEDREIQVAVDDLTGKIVVVWRRYFAEGFGQILIGVFKNSAWERVDALSLDVTLNPRFPATRLTHVETTVNETVEGQDEPVPVVVRDSFVHVVWWEGVGESQNGTYALLRLTADAADAGSIELRNLDTLIPVGTSCEQPPAGEVIEHPLFASNGARDRALVFFGSQRICLFHLAEVSFAVETDPGPPPELGVHIQRRRHMPIFGVRRAYRTPESFDMAGARMLLGGDLRPVTYRVENARILFVTNTAQGWSPVRTLPVTNGLTLDQAIPLVEELAR